MDFFNLEYIKTLVNILVPLSSFVNDIHPFDVNTLQGKEFMASMEWADWIDSINTTECIQLLIDIHEQKQSVLNQVPNTLKLFIEQSWKYRLQQQKSISRNIISKGMNQKKWHEIHILSNVLFDIASSKNISVVLDMGSGLGTLSGILAQKLHVVAIESDTLRNHKSKLVQNNHRIVHVCEQITEYNAMDVVQEATTNIPHNHRFLMTGLHACGDLSAKTMIDLFLKHNHILAMVSIGCCYHWIHLDSFPRSKAVQSSGFSFTRSFLKVSQNDFVTFTRNEIISLWKQQVVRAIVRTKGRIKVGVDETLSSAIERYCQKYNVLNSITMDEQELLWKRIAFLSTIRSLLGPLVEALILLDRYHYVKESGCEHVSLVPLFDSDISPRNHALICIKQT